MIRKGVFVCACLLVAASPSTVLAAYVYPGSAAFQPLAVMEPVTEGSMFRTFTPVDPASGWSLGVGYDAYRVREDNADKDVLASVTAGWSPAPRWVAGLTLPYIVRDPEQNESGLLDARLFVRRLFLQRETGFRLGGELSVTAPTGGTGDIYPLSLESAVVSGRVAAATTAGRMSLGVNAGYQTYLESEEGSDSDLLYGLYAEHAFSDRLSGIVEFAGSSHSHSGSGDGSVSDDYVSIGARYRFASGYRLGLGAAVGSGDSFADGRLLATFHVPIGGKTAGERVASGPSASAAKAPKAAAATSSAAAARTAVPVTQPATALPAAPPPAATAPAAPKAAPVPVPVPAAKAAKVQVRVRNASGIEGLGRQAATALKERGYSVVGLSDPDGSAQKRTVILYPAGMIDQALSLARALNVSKVVRDVQLSEGGKDGVPGVLVLLIGSDQKK